MRTTTMTTTSPNKGTTKQTRKLIVDVQPYFNQTRLPSLWEDAILTLQQKGREETLRGRGMGKRHKQEIKTKTQEDNQKEKEKKLYKGDVTSKYDKRKPKLGTQRDKKGRQTTTIVGWRWFHYIK
jgi:hypothetical protein